MPRLRAVAVYEPNPRPTLACEVASAPSWQAVCELPGGHPADMAIHAGHAAIDVTGLPRERVEWLLHSGTGPQASAGWPVHHYIKDEILGPYGNALEVKQHCAAGTTNWLLASRLLDQGRAILCTAADNWSWGDRFVNSREQGGRPFSDVAHAAIIDSSVGFADLVGWGTAAQPGDAEIWHTRTNFWEATNEADFRAAYDRALNSSTRGSGRAFTGMLKRAIAAALAEASISPQYLTHFIPPTSGNGKPYRELAKSMDLPWSAALHEYGLTRGYLAGSGQASGLVHLAAGGALKAGSLVMLLGVEYQCSATALIFHVTQAPEVHCIRDVKVTA